jgi:hypothetical protein
MERRFPPQLPPLGSLPPVPLWPDPETSMRDWLVAKIEEEKRRQEEEKTKQEALRVRRREIELSMLQDSIQYGISSQLVPILFASVGERDSANTGPEWLQQYKTQLDSANKQQPRARARIQLSSAACNEARTIDQSEPVACVGHLQASQSISTMTPARLEHLPPGEAQSPALSVTLTHGNGSIHSESGIVQPPNKNSLLTFDARGLHYPQFSRPNRYQTDVSKSPAVAQPMQQASLAQQRPTYPSICFHQWTPPITRPRKDSKHETVKH